MPRYRRKKEYNGFRNVNHLVQFLTRTSPNSKEWAYFKKAASKHDQSDFRARTQSLHSIENKHPKDVAKDVLHELRKHRRDEDIGGGITETLHFLGNATRIPGAIQSLIANPYIHKEIPYEKKQIANALDLTYKDIGQRPARVGNLTRVSKYDTPRYSVWKQINGQYLITVHGTKLSNASDIGDDLKLAVGFSNAESKELQSLVKEFTKAGIEYDIAGHSLATEFIQNLDLSNADSIYLFNAASSPLQSSQVLNERANDDKYTYFLNPSDLVSDGIFHQMNNNTLANSYIGKYNFSPLSAHSLSQWYDENTQIEYDLTPEQQVAFDEDKGKRDSYRTHLLGTLKMRNIDKAAEKDDNN